MTSNKNLFIYVYKEYLVEIRVRGLDFICSNFRVLFCTNFQEQI